MNKETNRVKLLDTTFKDKKVMVYHEESEEGVKIIVQGNATIVYNERTLVNNTLSGALTLIPEYMLGYVQKNKDYVDKNGIDLNDGFTIYPEGDKLHFRYWLYTPEQLKNYLGNGTLKLVHIDKISTLFHDLIKEINLYGKYVPSHESDSSSYYSDIVIDLDKFIPEKYEELSKKWHAYNDYTYGLTKGLGLEL